MKKEEGKGIKTKEEKIFWKTVLANLLKDVNILKPETMKIVINCNGGGITDIHAEQRYK